MSNSNINEALIELSKGEMVDYLMKGFTKKQLAEKVAELAIRISDLRLATTIERYAYKCDVCGKTPSVMICTQRGTFCVEHAQY